MHDKVSYHACIRFLERVLHLPVAVWLRGKEHLNEKVRAEHCCECAGLPVAVVRQMVLIPPVVGPLLAGFTNCYVKHDGMVYVIRHGTIATIITERMHDERTGRGNPIKDIGRSEGRKSISKARRRNKCRNYRDRMERAD